MKTNDPGLSVAYFKLLELLYNKKIITVEDLDYLHRELTDISGYYEMNATQRASIEEMSVTFNMLRPDKVGSTD